MKGIGICKLTVLVTVLHTFFAQGSVIRFAAYPSVIKTNLTTSASMRCSLANTQQQSSHNIGRRSLTNTTEDVFHVTSIYITNTIGDDIASISPRDGPIGYVAIGNLNVKGDVSGTSSEGFLELSWSDPSAVALGGYECIINTETDHHHTLTFSSVIEIAEEAPTVSDVIAELNNVKNQQTVMAQTLHNQEVQNTKQEEEITKLKECGSHRSGFMSVMSSGKTFSTGQKIIYDKVLYTSGGGFDPQTGVFTCQEPGIYSFRIHALSNINNDIRLNLKLNSSIMTSAYSYDSHGQIAAASTSALLHLKKNDQVYVECAHGGQKSSKFFSNSEIPQNSVFSGHMEQSDCFL